MGLQATFAELRDTSKVTQHRKNLLEQLAGLLQEIPPSKYAQADNEEEEVAFQFGADPCIDVARAAGGVQRYTFEGYRARAHPHVAAACTVHAPLDGRLFHGEANKRSSGEEVRALWQRGPSRGDAHLHADALGLPVPPAARHVASVEYALVEALLQDLHSNLYSLRQMLPGVLRAEPKHPCRRAALQTPPGAGADRAHGRHGERPALVQPRPGRGAHPAALAGVDQGPG